MITAVVALSLAVQSADPQSTTPDSLYWAGREETVAENHLQATRLFREIREEHPSSSRVGNALYWEAFNLQRVGGSQNLTLALELLARQEAEFPDASTRHTGELLTVRIQTERAQSGNSAAVLGVYRVGRVAPSGVIRRVDPDACGRSEDVRVAAVNALVQIAPDSAVAAIRRQLDSNENCSESLRSRAPLLLSQIYTDAATDLLLRLALEEDNPSVRQRAASFLSVREDPALDQRLSELLRQSDDLSSGRVLEILARRESVVAKALLDSITSDASTDSATLQRVEELRSRLTANYSTVTLREIPDTSTANPRGAVAFLTPVGEPVVDVLLRRIVEQERSLESRGIMLDWLLRQKDDFEKVLNLYDQLEHTELKIKAIYGYAQRDELEALDLLIRIAKEEKDLQAQRTAIYWLGQSDDPRAVRVLAEIANW